MVTWGFALNWTLRVRGGVCGGRGELGGGVGLFCEAAPLEDVKRGHFILGELSDLWCKGAE